MTQCEPRECGDCGGDIDDQCCPDCLLALARTIEEPRMCEGLRDHGEKWMGDCQQCECWVSLHLKKNVFLLG